ncbi:MAG: divergent PAP2 family protein [Oscillospiraceae bacterium]|nr:divergent PAP2 family protein [Oscillospiraceae bacterium]
MHTLVGILHNPFLISAVTAWLTAQIIKTILYLLYFREFNFERMWGSGGMPSAHSATVCALAVAAGLHDGFDDYPFAIATVFALVVMYDACGVRRAAGQHAKMLNKLEEIIFSKDFSPEDRLKELIGHTPLQVLAGAMLGIVIAVVLFFI